MRPSRAGLECTHVGVRQRLRPVVTHSWVNDDASGRVEAVEIQAQEQAIAGSGLIVESRSNHPVIGLSALMTQIGVQCINSVRYLLEVYGISRIRRGIVARQRQRPDSAQAASSQPGYQNWRPRTKAGSSDSSPRPS